MGIFPLGIVLGFSIAALPGPIFFLILSETIRQGARAGLAVLVGPISVDAIVILPVGLLFQTMAVSKTSQRFLSLVGALFLCFTGFRGLWSWLPASGDGFVGDGRASRLRSYGLGAVTQLVNPFGYLYWMTMGGSLVLEAKKVEGMTGAVLVPLGFWCGGALLGLVLVGAAGGVRWLFPVERLQVLSKFASALIILAGGWFLLRTLRI